MKSLQIDQIPDAIHAELESRARQNHRSISLEVVAILSRQCMGGMESKAEASTALDEADRISSLVRGPGLTIAEIQGAIDEGRN